MNYKSLSSILGVVIFALLWTVLFGAKLPFQSQKPTPIHTPEIKILGQQTPDGFPTEFVLPKGASQVSNYITTISGIRTDLNQQFATDQSAGAIVEYYQKIFSTNGWQTQTLVDEAKNKVITAVRGDLNAGLFVSIVSGSDGSSQTQARLSISRTEKK